MVRRLPGEQEPPCSNPGFPRSSHTVDFKIGTLVTTLPGARGYRVSVRTGRPGVRAL